MLKSATFWTTEKDAPLLILNKGYLQSQGDAIFERVSTWPALAGAPSLENVTILEPENADRILIADSERTFRSEQNRAIFVKLLNHFHTKFGDYHQGLSYVASFLSLSLPEHDVVSLITHLNYTEKYLPGYWKHEAVQFGKDAYGFQELALKHTPKVAQHLQKNFVDPTSYLQKWFIGLFVHVLPFEFLFQFFEGFLEGGFKYSFQFGLSLLNQLSDILLPINNDYSKFTGILRLEAKFIPHDEQFSELLKRAFAGAKDYNLDDVNFNELRDQMYEKHLRVRMEAAKKSFDEKDEDEIEDCQICKDDFPEVYCKECNLKICENCHNKPPADSKHQRSHKVKEIEEDEEEEEEEESDKEDEDEKSDAAVDKAAADLEKLTVNA